MPLPRRIRRTVFGAALYASFAPCLAQTENHAVRDFPDSLRAGARMFSLHKNDRVIIQSPESATAKTRIGDTLIIRSSSAALLDENAQALLLDLIKRQKAITTLSESLMQTGGQAIAKNDTLQTHWQEAHRIDSIAFLDLRSKFDAADKLITRSTRNTERAIIQSYVTAIMLGAVAGGLTGGALADHRALGFLAGAGVGAAAGGLLNLTLLKIPISLGSK